MIEKERQEMKLMLEECTTPSAETETPTINTEVNDEMKDVMSKSLEELEAERDALLRQVRNPEPPVYVEAKDREFEKPTITQTDSDEENLEVRRAKKTKVDINGDMLRIKTMSESSTGESSPCSQVSK